MLCLQRVKARCVGKHAPSGIKVLPFDLIGPKEDVQQAVEVAVTAFPGAPLSYLVHNAGRLVAMCWCYSKRSPKHPRISVNDTEDM